MGGRARFRAGMEKGRASDDPLHTRESTDGLLYLGTRLQRRYQHFHGVLAQKRRAIEQLAMILRCEQILEQHERGQAKPAIGKILGG